MNSLGFVTPAVGDVVSSGPSRTQPHLDQIGSENFQNDLGKTGFPYKNQNFNARKKVRLSRNIRAAAPISLLSCAVMAACNGASISQMMPGTAVTVDGIPFTVSDSRRGLTVRNFETDATPLAVLSH